MIGVVMPVVNCLEYSKQTYESFRSSEEAHWIVIDNGSRPDVGQFFGNLDGVTYLRNERNIGVAASWNLGIQKAFEQGAWAVVVVNNDLIFAPDTVDKLLGWLMEDRCFITATSVGSSPDALEAAERRHIAMRGPQFCCFALTPKCLSRVGLFDETFWPAYFEDDDYSLRLDLEDIEPAAACDALVCHLGSRTIHEGGVSINEDFSKNQKHFVKKWGATPGHALNERLKRERKAS